MSDYALRTATRRPFVGLVLPGTSVAISIAMLAQNASAQETRAVFRFQSSSIFRVNVVEINDAKAVVGSVMDRDSSGIRRDEGLISLRGDLQEGDGILEDIMWLRLFGIGLVSMTMPRFDLQVGADMFTAEIFVEKLEFSASY